MGNEGFIFFFIVGMLVIEGRLVFNDVFGVLCDVFFI